MQQGGLIQEKTTQSFICFGADGAFFLRLSHWNDITIEGEIFSLYDGVVLHGP
jgi:hypothetical protein